jgi:3-deoxy-D-manno-octulosonic-acid transferase
VKFLIDLLYLLAIAAISPKIIYRMIRHKRYRGGWSERLGRVSRKHPDKKCIWIHAVSVGEVNATRTLADRLGGESSDCEIVISATTDTGLARAKSLYGDKLSVFYFPFDLSGVVSRALERIRPNVIVLMELEVWPNLTAIAGKQGIAVVVANGRLSDKSFPRYKLIRSVIRPMFSRLSLVLAQTSEYAERFRYLGCPAEKVIVTNSLKYDTARITDKIDGADEMAARLNIGADRLLVAGGTGPGEEKIVLEVLKELKKYRQFGDLRAAIVPRKPERFDEVAGLIAQAGFEFVRYSEIKNTDVTAEGRKPIILGDTMGDLPKFYSLADVVFVGRSLTPMGGSDMMEPAAMSKCTIFGPHTFNFKQTVDALLAGGGAIEVQDEKGLLDTVRKCLTDRSYSDTVARNGQEVIRRNQGATARTAEAIRKLLEHRGN